MKNFDAAMVTELAKEIFSFFVTVELQFTTTYYYTDLDIPVHYGGTRYIPTAVKLSDIAYTGDNSVDSITLTFGNADLGMSSLLLNEDIRNKTVILSLGALNNARTCIGLENVFQGMVSEWKIDETEVTITVVNEFIFWRKKTLRNCANSCSWEFKGTECGYAGGENWCDKSYDRCDNLHNGLNYGGFRYVSALALKKVWWGQQAELTGILK